MSIRTTTAVLACATLAGCVGPSAPVPTAASRPTADPTVARSIAADLDLAVLTRALAAAGLTASLDGPGPITMFAPTDQAFGRLAPAALTALFRPENKPALIKLLRLHMVVGAVSGSDLTGRIAAGGGQATLISLAGEPLVLTMTESAVTLTDAAGDKSYVELADRRLGNGVVHIVNGVLVPRLD